MKMTDTIELLNKQFKSGRRAGQEDVALEILKHPVEQAHKIVAEFLKQGDKDDN